MDKLIPTPEPKKFSFLDHFNNPGEAVGWVVLVAIVITIFFLFCYGGVRVMKKWVPTIPPLPQGATPREAAQIRDAYTSHPVRAVGLGLLRVRRVLGKVGGGLGAVTRWVLTHLQRSGSRSPPSEERGIELQQQDGAAAAAAAAVVVGGAAGGAAGEND